MAAKRRKAKRRKGSAGAAALRWLAMPVGLALAALAAWVMLADAPDPHARRAPVASSPDRAGVKPKPTPVPVVVTPGSHDRDHISEDSRRRLIEILESDGESEKGAP